LFSSAACLISFLSFHTSLPDSVPQQQKTNTTATGSQSSNNAALTEADRTELAERMYAETTQVRIVENSITVEQASFDRISFVFEKVWLSICVCFSPCDCHIAFSISLFQGASGGFKILELDSADSTAVCNFALNLLFKHYLQVRAVVHVL
jgi:hypothetical protein